MTTPSPHGPADAVPEGTAGTQPAPQRHGDARERTISFLCMGLFDIGLTLVLYNTARANGVGEFSSYLLSMLGPLVSITIEFVRHRRLSMFSVFILSIQAVAALITLIGSTDPKILILKDSCLTAGIGSIFLLSTLVGKPVTFYLGQKFATDGSPEGTGEWNRMWHAYPQFRRTQRIIGLGWGVAYLVEALIRVVAVYTLPFDTAFNLGATLPIVVTVLVIAWTFWMATRARRRGEAARTARQAAERGEGAQAAPA